MAKTFTERGEKALLTCHTDLQRVLRLARTWSDGLVEWDVVQGGRSVEQQQAYFDAGNSKVNPKAYASLTELYKDAKHVTGPGMELSRAADIVLTTTQPNGPYDQRGLAFVAGVVFTAAKSLGVNIRWGADWKKDFTLYKKGAFIDAPHFELM